MKNRASLFFGVALLVAASPALAQRYSDDDIRKMLINDSIATSGDCPCPYSMTWNNKQCEGKSVYSTSGSIKPLCYPSDVSPYMVEEYRRRVLSR